MTLENHTKKRKPSFPPTWFGKSTRWIGSTRSLIGHTVFFTIFFVLGFKGYDWERLLIVLTTLVSLEAIYLSIFIQMTINRNTQSLEEVEEGLDEIQENIDEIQDEVDEITFDDKDGQLIQENPNVSLQKIEVSLQKLMDDVQTLQKQNNK